MRESWGFWRHVREMLDQLVTVSGVMLFGSFITTIYVAVAVPGRSLEWLVFWNVAMIANHTGRWILPQGIRAWSDVKTAEAIKPPGASAPVTTVTSTVTSSTPAEPI